jgi:hypothetical protein
MARWPDFFIVGAPRAGTTSLYNYLRGCVKRAKFAKFEV